MRILLSAIVAVAAAGAAFAQPAAVPGDPHHPPTAESPAAGPGMMGMMPMMSGMNCPMMGGRTEGTLAFLKTELKITPVQNGKWEAFATAYRDFATARRQMMQKMGDQMMQPGGAGGMGPMKGSKSMPFPDRMATHTQMMEGRIAAAKKLHAATGPLYAALSSEQKATADQLLPMFTMMGGMM